MLNFFLAGAKSVGIMAHEEKAFVAYMRETNHFFTGDEYHFRLGIFLTNKRLVQEHNKANKGFLLGLNHLAHLTPAEYKVLLGAKPKYQKNLEYVQLNNKADAEVDWRTKGVITPIKDQGACGSCWAFSTISCSEARWAQAGNKLLTLAEQNIVDCVDTEFGCGGGWPSAAIDYVYNKQNGKFMLESDYPYTAEDGECKFDASKGVAQTKGQKAVPATEADLAKAVSDGVVSICIDASHYTFQLYKSGIYYEPGCSPDLLDHAVSAVGYGSEQGQNYWIVRNSWSTGWGEQGYIRMIKDKDNNCGVATKGVLPNKL